jgi:hypothetical protein
MHIQLDLKVVEFFQVQHCGRVRRLGHRLRWHRRSRWDFRLFRSRLATGTKMLPDLISKIVIERTGMRFLIGNTQFRQVVQNQMTFHFQFSCQFVNPNLSHA